jgi:hypothetical protein
MSAKKTGKLEITRLAVEEVLIELGWKRAFSFRRFYQDGRLVNKAGERVRLLFRANSLVLQRSVRRTPEEFAKDRTPVKWVDSESKGLTSGTAEAVVGALTTALISPADVK